MFRSLHINISLISHSHTGALHLVIGAVIHTHHNVLSLQQNKIGNENAKNYFHFLRKKFRNYRHIFYDSSLLQETFQQQTHGMVFPLLQKCLVTNIFSSIFSWESTSVMSSIGHINIHVHMVRGQVFYLRATKALNLS